MYYLPTIVPYLSIWKQSFFVLLLSDKKSFYACYVTKNRKLIGRLSVKDLLLAENDDVLIDSLMKTNVIHVHTHDDQEEVSKLLQFYIFLFYLKLK